MPQTSSEQSGGVGKSKEEIDKLAKEVLQLSPESSVLLYRRLAHGYGEKSVRARAKNSNLLADRYLAIAFTCESLAKDHAWFK